jgi:periplasmic divalent cation tolerance protein
LVEERLAACANIIGPVRSLYWWEGKLQDEPEAICLCKTRADLVARLAQRVKELHSYECPCVVAVPIVGGNPAFIEWIARETGERY